MAPILKQVVDGLGATYSGTPLSLWTRYPKPSSEGEADLGLAMWKSFFALYDFRPVPQQEGARQTILERKLRPLPRPAARSGIRESSEKAR